MPTKLSRFIAVLLLVFPGWMATYGFLLMKNSVFDSFGPGVFPWLTFILGLFLFAVGVAFIGGWIFYRDRKRNYVAPRFREKKKQRRQP
jgi:small neutral amino acid transporter SnatA (MarC family)